MEPSRDRPAFPSSADAPKVGLPRNQNQDAADMFPPSIGEVSLGPTIFGNRAPIDVPDEFPGVVPEFRSRRKAEALPKLRPAQGAKGFDWWAWRIGVACGGLAFTVGHLLALLNAWGL